MVGFLIVDKPKGLTSHDVVKRVRNLFPKSVKVGHTGTLDPLATGVLIISVGKATRLSEFLLKRDKSYKVKGILGLSSPTYDVDGEIKEVECKEVGKKEFLKVLSMFRGEIEQKPPPFSAVRIRGKRAYELARKGEKVELTKRRVKIYEIDLLSFSYPEFELLVRCSSGTYIRSLVHDIGMELSCDAVVSELRRTCVGDLCENDAVPLERVIEEGVEKFLKSPEEVLGFPKVKLSKKEEKLFINGVFLNKELPKGYYSVLSEEGKFLGVGVSNGELLKPEKVIVSQSN